MTRIRTIAGYWWHAKPGFWTVPYSRLVLLRLMELFSGQEIHLDHKLEPLLKKQEEATGPANPAILENVEKARYLQMMEGELKLRGYSLKTIPVYVGHMQRFLAYWQRDPLTIRQQEVRDYLLHLLGEQNASHSYVNQAC